MLHTWISGLCVGGLPRPQRMGKHGEKEFDIDDMGLLVFGMEENWEGENFLIGVFWADY